MKNICKTVFAACLILLMAACNKYNPFDSYYHGGIDRPDTGGKPGKGGLFADGFGTEESPYGLSTPQHMQNISRGLVPGEMVYFKLKNDIDMSGISWTALNSISPYDKFIDFDGGGYVISNLYCPQQPYGGFFGVLCGTCHDVGFLNAYAESSNSGGILGGYIGLANPSDGNYTGLVERVYLTGTVRANNQAGGFCGIMGKTADMVRNTINECYSLVEVNGTDAGGFVGEMREGEIMSSYCAGKINGSASDGKVAGGLVGAMKDGSISNSIAWNKSIASGSSRGPVYGSKESGTISECYSLSTMSGAAATNEGVTKKTTEELQAIASAWAGSWYTDGKVSNGYPILTWQFERGDYAEFSGHGGGGGGAYKPAFKAGTGIESDPYQIETLVHLRSMHDTLKANSTTYFKLVKDIDAMSLDNWQPLNTKDPYDIIIHFDGNGKTISNLSSSGGTYPSFFGVLNGSCKNVTFKNCEITQSDSSPCGILGGYAGANNGASAIVTNVTIDGGAVTSSGHQPCGGLFGVSVNSSISNCISSATVSSSNSSTKTSDQGTGGLIGKALAGTSITGCQSNGTVNGVRLCGGIAGWTTASGITITECSNSAKVTAANSGSAVGQRSGGIVGHLATGCSVSKCSNTATIAGVGMQGGIVGYLEGGSVSCCYSTGNVSASGNFAGGLVGYVQEGNVTNCYVKGGTLTIKGQSAGGIAGEVKNNATISNCWTSMTLNGQRMLGGIAGRSAFDGYNATTTDEAKQSNITVSKCIAWNPSIVATDKGDYSAKGSSGGIVAYTYIKNTLTDNYRRKDMVFESSYDGYTLKEHENVSATAPLSGFATYCYPYDGKSAAESASVSSVATSLGWDTSVWNLSGNEPTLK